MSRARFTLLYILAWVPLALLYAVVLASQRGVAVTDGLWGAGFSIGIAALLGAVAWWLSTRIPYERTHRVRDVGLYRFWKELRIDDDERASLCPIDRRPSRVTPQLDIRHLGVATINDDGGRR